MEETAKTKKFGYNIFSMLDTIKSKFPEECIQYLYDGVYIGLKSDYIRYITDPSRNNRMQFFMLFVKDNINRSDTVMFTRKFKSNKDRWFYLCSGFNKFDLADLTNKMRKELYNYIMSYNITVIDYYNKFTAKDEKLFYFDDSAELHGNNKYAKYVDDFVNKYTNNP